MGDAGDFIMRLRYVVFLALLSLVPLVAGCEHTHKSQHPCCPAPCPGPCGQPAVGAVPAPPGAVALPPQYTQSGYGQIGFGR